MTRFKLYTAIGFILSAVFLYIAVSRLDAGSVVESLGQSKLFPYLPLSIAFYLLGHLVRGLRCRLLIQRDVELTTSAATNVVVLGYAANNILPGRLGEFVRAGVLAEQTGLPFAQTLTVTLVERLADGLVLLGMLSFSGLLLGISGPIATMIKLGVIVFGVAVAGVGMFLFFPDFIVQQGGRWFHRLSPGLQSAAVRTLNSIALAVRYYRDPANVARFFGLSIIVWLLEAGLFAWLLPAFGIKAGLLEAMFTMSFTNLGILVPSTPGYIGTFHFFTIEALSLLGVGSSTSAGYAVLVHAAFFIPITLWGAGLLAFYGISISRMRAIVDAARPTNPFPVAANNEAVSLIRASTKLKQSQNAPSTLLSALVKAALPLPQTPWMNDEQRVESVAFVSEFLNAQVRALPLRVRIMFFVGLSGFEFITVIRFGRRFASLEQDRGRRWFESWAYGKVGLARQLFRMIRSIALLAFYELPYATERSNSAQAARQA